MSHPIRIGVIGLGGFAGSHHSAIERLEARHEARLVCTCDPRATELIAHNDQWSFARRGVRVFADYREMLAACHRDLDVVVIPTPIQVHAEMHAAVAALGLPSYIEKPPTLDYAELDRMIGTDAALPRSSLVGFNFIIEQTRLALKERLLAGEFGAVRGATLTGLWPRPRSYFRRNNWAGRLRLDGHLVLDSVFGNALAHFVHNLLFWAGSGDLFNWARPAAVRAELYRAHAIEGADTFFVETDTTGGVTMRFALSHACSGGSSQVETVVCEHATLNYVVGSHAEIRRCDGRVEKIDLDPFDGLLRNHQEYYRYLNGARPRPATTLADSRPFVVLNDLAYVSSRQITPIPERYVSVERNDKEQKEYLEVDGLRSAQAAFLMHGTWPGANGWKREPPALATAGDLPRFHDTIAAMAQSSASLPPASGG
ncbi:MAG TPA: Gfo/Idh/MocA family oxidoreductase [Opitutus sp.]|nr:Gfo/Idh/MocA family oxidoreductase [Opitutus sp.]